MENTKILITLGPTSLNKEVILKLSSRQIDYFRINMSHTSIDELQKHIKTIRKYSDTPICIDSEGAQVRTSQLPEKTIFYDRQNIRLVSTKSVCDPNELGLWPQNVFAQLKPGDILTIDFDSALLVVTSISKNEAEATVLNGGSVGTNKAVTLFPSVILPPLSEKDIMAANIGLEYGIKDFALSFANTANDVMELRKIVGDKSNIISKIESKKSIRNLEEILKVTDAILIDRGDLSREVPIQNIPLIQKKIIKKSIGMNKNAYVATNLLESMMVNRKPTRAEVNDVINTLIDGAKGLVLAAETAIGENPIAAVDMLRSLISRFNRSYPDCTISQLMEYENLLLPEMHGLTSFSNQFSEKKLKSKDLDEYKSIDININTYLDTIQIVQGVYSPLNRFMGSEELESVLKNYKLLCGQTWTLPIIFQIEKELWESLEVGMTVALKYAESPNSKITMDIKELYKIDLKNVSNLWFGTNDKNHPGVKRLFQLGHCVVSGEVLYYNYEQNMNAPYFLTPKQTRMIFDIKGWSKIVAFHTRNVPHRAHEYLMEKAMERTNADGLFIQPVIGPKKKGDFEKEAIFGAYDLFIKSFFNGAILSSFLTYSRYSGPREAVFTALCRKNYGCTHFIVGRDHTGVGKYYQGLESQELFEKLGDIGIQIVYFNKVGYNKNLEKIEEGNEKDLENISGTLIRESIMKKIPIDEKIFRKEIFNFLIDMIDNNKPVFIK